MIVPGDAHLKLLRVLVATIGVIVAAVIVGIVSLFVCLDHLDEVTHPGPDER